MKRSLLTLAATGFLSLSAHANVNLVELFNYSPDTVVLQNSAEAPEGTLDILPYNTGVSFDLSNSDDKQITLVYAKEDNPAAYCTFNVKFKKFYVQASAKTKGPIRCLASSSNINGNMIVKLKIR